MSPLDGAKRELKAISATVLLKAGIGLLRIACVNLANALRAD